MRFAVLFLLIGSGLLAQRLPEPKVATYYFYWYRWPTEHFRESTPSHGHFHHFVDPKKVDYEDPDWHEAEFTAMASCGIDYALPVYWGAPGSYHLDPIRFSRAGMAPMVEALTRIEKRGATSIKLGLLYDTSTLLNEVRGMDPRSGKADLREPEGKELFCRTVIEFFERIPERFWARLDGRALVVLFSSQFAAGWDKALGPALRASFVRRFPGEGVFLVADRSWGDIGQDATTGWGAALGGPQLHDRIAQIGPGYDDSAVRGQKNPRALRDQGNFYRWSWRKAIHAKPRLVLLETWNEMHEGTEICETKETGRLYLDITREYVRRLREGNPGPPIRLRYGHPYSRPDFSWGREVKNAASVFVDYTGAKPWRVGLTEVTWEDGPVRVHDNSLRPFRARVGETFAYFKISDFFCFESDVELVVEIELAWNRPRNIQIDYDAFDRDSPCAGAYTRAAGKLVRVDRSTERLVCRLPHARCANRQNGRADFRLRIREARTVIRSVRVRIAGEKSGKDKGKR